MPKFSFDELEFNVRKMINILIQDSINISSNIHRLDQNGQGDYLIEVKNDLSIKFILSDIFLSLDKEE